MVTGDHGEVMVTAANIVEAVFKSDSDIVIIPPLLMAVKDVTDMLRWSRRATHMDVEVRILFFSVLSYFCPDKYQK